MKHITTAQRSLEAYAGDPSQPENGVAYIDRMVGPEQSTSMGVGILRLEGISVPWTVLYDEAIMVIEGRFRLRVEAEVFDCEVGDVLWIPENTPVVYEAAPGTVTTLFYTLYPVDWRAKNGL